MRIDFVELANFRRLRAVRVDFAKEKTVFVGANNSGKTSAMVALRRFLVARERKRFSLTDFSLSYWPEIDTIGRVWEKAQDEQKEIPKLDLDKLLPFLDLWLQVEQGEEHYVQKVIPSLDWKAGLLGLRLRLEPEKAVELQTEFLAARTAAKAAQNGGVTAAEKMPGEAPMVALWPESLTAFLERKLGQYLVVRAYPLDPTKCVAPQNGAARPQALVAEAMPLEGDPLRGLIRIDEIAAQRGFGAVEADQDDDDVEGFGSVSTGSRKLSDQLRSYYKRHLDPAQTPDAQDIAALKAIEDAQKAFDERLRDGFSSAISELGKLGYPGFADPQIRIATRLKPIDGLNHESAVQYAVVVGEGEAAVELHLPEESNGLGYQNLISMVFRLMSYRDAWMRVRKAQARLSATDQFVPPLHLVLVEEPEAYLHTQVQQVFIREAYAILRNHDQLRANTKLSTQLVVSTHSTHIAHECEFAALRYFRRMPAEKADIPTSNVMNLTKVFGEENDTKRFVTRYLKVTHCDLFFADAAILVEGPAERLLVPHFVRRKEKYRYLRESYVTWLEIAGSHAHRLRTLIEHLGLPTLVIGDLDAMEAKGGTKKVPPARGIGQRTRNATLKQWHPEKESLDELLDLPSNDKVKAYPADKFSIRVAYQMGVMVSVKGSPAVEVLANTLEDALVLANIELFEKLDGTGLIETFRDVVKNSTTAADLAKALFDSIPKNAPKAEFSLDLLSVDPDQLTVPAYIDEGLDWLAEELRKRCKDLGLPITAIVPAGGAA